MNRIVHGTGMAGKGFPTDFLPAEDRFHLTWQKHGAAAKPFEVRVPKLKAVRLGRGSMEVLSQRMREPRCRGRVFEPHRAHQLAGLRVSWRWDFPGSCGCWRSRSAWGGRWGPRGSESCRTTIQGRVAS